ncbi:OmpA family protein [Flavobacterium sp. ASW18X]|uniref:OmpA family protein n=1 Tax=Flavobacterium sp. ASW18X TaxID=2572595 RepID=UPI0010AE52AA|nr:OmpA family protein [Flavobacterium sp. ASW18X]TKD65110.1 DUF1416 domain-containing protein [Flavobacterium sp. ASW18X]
MKKLAILIICFISLQFYGQSVSLLEFEDAVVEEAILETEKENDSITKTKKVARSTYKGVNDKLIKKADDYYDKLWYSEAAKVYDIAMSKKSAKYPMDVYVRAGDSHYFNSNMEMASKYYELAYKDNKEEIANDDLFKYAHSLKGIGRYNKAKRIMRLFNKRNTLVTSSEELATTKEKLLEENSVATSQPYEVNIKNLNINSKYSDFSPMLLDDNQLVYASAVDSAFLKTRRYKWNSQPYLDLYVGDVNDEKSKVSNVEKFPKEINSKYHEAAVTFSPDKNTIYFTRNNYGKKLKRDQYGVNHLKIYTSTKTEEGWTEAVELPFNSEDYSTGHPAMSPDGKRLYFVSDMPGGFGQTDVYYVTVDGNGAYSAPINLGETVNSRRKEMFPFVTENALYFSSDRGDGYGGLDIYKTTITEEGFGKLKILGEPINSNRDDFSFIIDEDLKNGYFASNRDGGKGDDDIYSFDNLEIKPPVSMKSIVEGQVVEKLTGDPIKNAIITLLDEEDNIVKEVETDEDGRFIFNDIERNSNYKITSNREEFKDYIQDIVIQDQEKESLVFSLSRKEAQVVLEDGVKKLKVENINFGFDKYNINQEASVELDKLLRAMEQYPSMVIKIESHTDSRGSRAYNQYLSDKRAKSTRDYLIAHGVAPERIASAIGYGEDRLLNDCADGVPCSRTTHLENRRSEFIIVEM